jgi:hypothetical protein
MNESTGILPVLTGEVARRPEGDVPLCLAALGVSPVSTGENQNGPHLTMRTAFDSKSTETQFGVHAGGEGPYWLSPAWPGWAQK